MICIHNYGTLFVVAVAGVVVVGCGFRAVVGLLVVIVSGVVDAEVVGERPV